MIQNNRDTFFCGVQGGTLIDLSGDFLRRKKAYQPITWLPELGEEAVGAASSLLLVGEES